jgi:hypothetical protein
MHDVFRHTWSSWCPGGIGRPLQISQVTSWPRRTDAGDRVAIFVDGALPAPAAGLRLDAIAQDFLPEGHENRV